MNIHDFKLKKQQQKKITGLTCYEYLAAKLISESPLDFVLVGDSVAMVMHGYDSTLMANIDMMVMHTQAVARGLTRQFLISDLPFLAHRYSHAQTIEQVRQLMQAGAKAVKIEGADTDTCQTIAYLTAAGIPIMGHIGLTPQSIHQLGGYKVQGKNKQQAEALIKQAINLEAAGCFAIVIECVPQPLAKAITAAVSVPTIGIGAGSGTDGQILVWHDILGLQTDFKPKFLKQYVQGKALFLQAINAYVQQVQQVQFPSEEYAFEE